MFSKAKRFDYPTPEAKALPMCIRCVKKHNNCICSSNSKIPISTSRIFQQKKNSTALNETFGVFTISTSNVIGNVSDDSVYTTPINSICHSSGDKGFHPSFSAESTNILSTAPNSSLSYESHSDKEQTFSSATFTRKKSCMMQIVNTDVHYSSESSISLSSFEDEVEYDEVFDRPLQASGLHAPDPTKQELLEYLEDVEQKVDEQLKKISDLRLELMSSGNEGFVRTPLPQEMSIQERLKNLEATSMFCVKEALDFVILHKNGEKKGKVRPNEYEDLVEFCWSLIGQLKNLKLKKEERENEKKMWSKIKKFVGRVIRPF